MHTPDHICFIDDTTCADCCAPITVASCWCTDPFICTCDK